MTEVKLSYPLQMGSTRLLGPTLIYLDDEGIPIQLRLNDAQVQMIVDDWNKGDLNPDEARLSPPVGGAKEGKQQ